MSNTELALDTIRKKVFFHNSIDVWISACEEKNMDWFNIDNYKKFLITDEGLIDHENINPNIKRDDEQKIVHVEYEIEKGEKYKINLVNIKGNTIKNVNDVIDIIIVL